METKILTPKQIEKARADHYYLNAKTNRSYLLSGAEFQWRKNVNYIYVSKYRIAGPKDEIEARLRASGFAEEDIKTAVERAYSLNMNPEIWAEFNQELDALYAYRTGKMVKNQQNQQNQQNQLPEPVLREDNFGSEFDLERAEMLNPDLFEKLTNNQDLVTELLRKLILDGKIFLVDKENMHPWKADSVVLLTDGNYIITHPR